MDEFEECPIQAYTDGAETASMGLWAALNPFPANTLEHEYWWQGYYEEKLRQVNIKIEEILSGG